MEQAISERLAGFIRDEQLPYVFGHRRNHWKSSLLDGWAF